MLFHLNVGHVLCNFVIIIVILDLSSEFEIPNVTLEAYNPSGFRASIPAEPGIELFAFHGKINQPISETEYGIYTADIKNARNGMFSYYHPGLKLKQGDVVNYWVFVQHDQLGYRKNDQSWTVENLIDGSSPSKPTSKPPTTKPSPSTQKTLFEDNFDGNSLDTDKWLQEQYIPAGPDYEFVSYQKDQEVTFVSSGMLQIKPKFIEDQEALRKDIDLTNGCTRPGRIENQCFLQFFGILSRPVISGRLVSKTQFSGGRVEIKAKLPKGDWIFPEIYLEDVNDPEKRIWIAYARGNEKLIGDGGDDIGNTLLFGGPVLDTREPERSSHLSSFKSGAPISDSVHKYSLKWKAGQIDLFIDGNKYGSIFSPDFRSNQVRLVLGVGVGGISDFPDGYTSSNGVMKPWVDATRNQTKDFFVSRKQWLRTWSDIGRRLQVDYVRITEV